MRRGDLPALVLKHVAHSPLKDSGTAAATLVEACGVQAQLRARAAGFDANHTNTLIAEERIEQPNRVRAAPDARDERVGQTPFAFKNLRARFAADDALKLANHERVRVRPERAPQKVVGVRDVRNPVAQRLVDRILESARAGLDLAHFSAEQAHAEDVEALAAHVLRAHVDDAGESEERADR